jgi:tRNA(fMet)-specific endonuclease VapC
VYLLDTNACIRIMNGSSAQLVERLRKHDPEEIRLCAIVKAELTYGARNSARVADNLSLLARFFGAFVSLPFDDQCAEHYGWIRTDLSRTGKLIGPHDLLIAATARANDLTLVSHNTREFSRVVGLRLEDWEAEGA